MCPNDADRKGTSGLVGKGSSGQNEKCLSPPGDPPVCDTPTTQGSCLTNLKDKSDVDLSGGL